MKRFFIAFLLIFVLVLSPLSVSAAQVDDPYAAEAGDPYAAYEDILAAWADEGYEMYPDYIGGVYTNPDGRLVVALSEDTEENRNKVLSLTSAPGVIEFEVFRYSYNELYGILCDINDSIDTDGYDFRVENAAIVEEENYIEVYVSDDYFSAASDYFSSAYGSKVTVSNGEIAADSPEYTDTDADTDYDDTEYDDFSDETGTESDIIENYNEEAFTAFSELTVAWAEAGYVMYPPYIGGVYFADNGNLAIALSDDTESNRNEILSHISCSPEYVEFASVPYSYDELYAIQDEIAENYNADKYSFLVNFYSINEEKNVVEIRVASSELEAASQYFSSAYGDKVVVYGGYETEDSIDYSEDSDSGSSAGEKIKATSKIRLYISIGLLAAVIVAVVLMSLRAANKASSSQRRYRK